MSSVNAVQPSSRLLMAREVAAILLNELEMDATPIIQCLMKAKRLARLLRDNDAQQWLDLETRGYPSNFDFNTIGSCLKYVYQGGRITDDKKYWLVSLPELEATIKADESAIANLRFPSNLSPSISSSNPNELTGAWIQGAINSLTEKFLKQLNQLRDSYVKNTKFFNALKSALHNYVADVQLALSLGDVAEDIFEEARGVVDFYIRSTCPKATEQLLAIHERLREGDTEALAQAMTSCRRLICTVADAVFPPRDELYTDPSGKNHKVGSDEYKNRLLAFIETRNNGVMNIDILISELEHLAARLDAVYEKMCKGIHAHVSRDEARLAIIHTYIFIAEVARVVSFDESPDLE